MATDLEMLRRSNELLAEAVLFVEPASLSSPTPCPEWDVRELLDHLTGGNRFTVNILAGMTADEALDRARWSFGPDHDPRVDVANSAERQIEAFNRPGALEHEYHHVVGELTGHQVLRLRLHDVAIHTWDLLQAVHPAEELDDVYVRWAIDELSKDDSLTARHIATVVANPTSSLEILMAFGRTQP